MSDSLWGNCWAIVRWRALEKHAHREREIRRHSILLITDQGHTGSRLQGGSSAIVSASILE